MMVTVSHVYNSVVKEDEIWNFKGRKSLYWYNSYITNWIDQEVVVDGKLITSREPKDLPAFMRAVIEAL